MVSVNGGCELWGGVNVSVGASAGVAVECECECECECGCESAARTHRAAAASIRARRCGGEIVGDQGRWHLRARRCGGDLPYHLLEGCEQRRVDRMCRRGGRPRFVRATERRLSGAHHALGGAAHADDRGIGERQLEAMRRAHVVEGLLAALDQHVMARGAHRLRRGRREVDDFALGPLCHGGDVLADLCM